MGYSREAGSQEGAVLIFAHDAKEARKLAYPFVQDWFGDGWTDCAVMYLKDRTYLFAEANQEKLTRGDPHVVDSPKVCKQCELWGFAMDDNGICENCQDDYYADRQ